MITNPYESAGRDNRLVTNQDGLTYWEWCEAHGIRDPDSLSVNYVEAWRDGVIPNNSDFGPVVPPQYSRTPGMV